LENIKKFIIEKTKLNGSIFGDKLPTSTKDGKYQFAEDGFWVGGFWGALNLLCYEMTGDMAFLDKERQSAERLRKRLYEKPKSLDHDLGFLYYLSFAADYKLTGDPGSRKIALDAAAMLRERFNERGKFIQAWNAWTPGDRFSEENKGRVIMDCMYNLPLLFWATEETGEESYRQVAIAHADTTARYLVRPDYTTYHTFVFDSETGEPIYGKTHQGYTDESCWARGQAWAVGGFTFVYRYTQDKKYLQIAEKCAKVFVDALEEDYIPMWDLSLKGKEGEPRDSSAAAIVATAFLELSDYVHSSKKDYYLHMAEKMLESLYTQYSSEGNVNDEGLIIHACGHKPHNKDIDCSLIYGDYYFAEAIAKLTVKNKKIW
jgi:unsaturated chondroitin disaccharide hydrolase